jgi:hypothetical protein
MTDLELELDKTVKDWVSKTFNFIPLEVVETYCRGLDDDLLNYIVYPSVKQKAYDWLIDSDYYSIMDSLKDDFKEELDPEYFLSVESFSFQKAFTDKYGAVTFIDFMDCIAENYEDEIQEMIDEEENYPLWGTIFEFRDDYWQNEIERLISHHNLGVIDGLEPFNTMVFMTSGGHSFYSAYWIPLYLNTYPAEMEKYKDVDYSHL